MTHTYRLSGITCSGCGADVKGRLLMLSGLTAAEVSEKENTVTITMESHIPLARLQQALGGESSKYRISALHHSESAEQAKSWAATYRPILLIFAFITIVSVLTAYNPQGFNRMQAMGSFMAGFFLVFSFFKLLSLSAFAGSYAMYDVIATRLRGWGYVYPFLELGLGLGYVIMPQNMVLNLVALILMAIGSVGVLKSVLSGHRIQCACLGAVFNLPMSVVTVIENTAMMAMSALMLLSV